MRTASASRVAFGTRYLAQSLVRQRLQRLLSPFSHPLFNSSLIHCIARGIWAFSASIAGLGEHWLALSRCLALHICMLDGCTIDLFQPILSFQQTHSNLLMLPRLIVLPAPQRLLQPRLELSSSTIQSSVLPQVTTEAREKLSHNRHALRALALYQMDAIPLSPSVEQPWVAPSRPAGGICQMKRWPLSTVVGAHQEIYQIAAQ